MQKISSYLYPNRVQLLADLAGFTTEYTNVYQRNVKIYAGIDNTVEFDIKNADQKRIDLATLSQIELNIMDQTGQALPSSPYTVTPTQTKGIATVTIPQEDINSITPQFLKYSVSAIKDGKDVILYADSRFGAVGRMELVGDAMPVIKEDRVYTDFYGEINFLGNVTNHTSAIPTKFYEAVPTETLSFSIDYTNFVGELYIEGTTDMTISVESFRNATKIPVFSTSTTESGSITKLNVDISQYNYVRVSWQYPAVSPYSPLAVNPFGTVDKVTVYAV